MGAMLLRTRQTHCTDAIADGRRRNQGNPTAPGAAFRPPYKAGYQIQQGSRYISVPKTARRMILKAGYHRSFAFSRCLRNDPEAKDRSLLVAVTKTLPPPLLPAFPKQGLRTTVLGSRAPLLSDFFNESLAMAVKLRKKRYEMHIRVGIVGINET